MRVLSLMRSESTRQPTKYCVGHNFLVIPAHVKISVEIFNNLLEEQTHHLSVYSLCVAIFLFARDETLMTDR